MTPPASFLTLCKQAAALCARRAPLYGIVTLAALGIQAALSFGFHFPHALLIGSEITLPPIATIAYVTTAVDAGALQLLPKQRWERILERTWAVIVIDFALTLAFAISLSAAAESDLGAVLMGTLALLLVATLGLAEPIASVEDGVPAWMLVPRSFARSISLTWSSGNLSRVLALFAVQLAIEAAALILQQQLLALRLEAAIFWANAPLDALLTIPFAALSMVVYLDCRRRADDRDR